MGSVEVDGEDPVLRGTGGSEEPLSMFDTGGRTWIRYWKEASFMNKQ